MSLTKYFLFLSIVVVVSFLGWSGCYTQLATNSDNPEQINNSPATVVDQPPQTPVIIIDPVIGPTTEPIYPHPWYPPPSELYPHPWNPPGSAGSTSTAIGTDSPAESPHRQSGYQRSPSTDQNNSSQTVVTPSRTSWSPAPVPTPSAPTPAPDSGTRTSGSTRGGR